MAPHSWYYYKQLQCFAACLLCPDNQSVSGAPAYALNSQTSRAWRQDVERAYQRKLADRNACIRHCFCEFGRHPRSGQVGVGYGGGGGSVAKAGSGL